MCLCDVILVISAILFTMAIIAFIVTYKIGKDETKNRPCGGGRHNA
jgi:hypothetical protein